MVAQQWKKLGIQLDVQESERNDGFARVRNNEHQIIIWQNDGSEQIFTFPRHALPVEPSEPNLGPLYAQWYASAGDKGKKPDDPQMLKVLELFGQAKSQTPEQAAKTAQEIWKILIEETWSIGTVGVSPAVSGVRIMKNTLGNVPAREANVIYARTPGTSHPVTAYFKS
jgi:peptide/nickel transport system substrate-binding protein